MIGGVKGSAIGEPFVSSLNVQLTITDTETYVQKPVDYVLADDPVNRLRGSPMGGVGLMKSIFGEK